MLRNLKTVLRGLRKKKFYTAINVFGLAVSFAASILITFWVQDERSFDIFHADYDHLYKVNAHLDPENNGAIWETSPGPIFNYATNSPGVEIATRIRTNTNVTLVNDELKRPLSGINMYFVDSNFFEIFNFPILEGSLDGFQENYMQTFITESTAESLFGTKSAVGMKFRYGEDLFSVAGVLDNIPQNSSLQFDAIIPMGYHAQKFTKNGGNGKWKTIDEDLGSYGFLTYIKTKKEGSPEAISKNITQAFHKAWENNSTAEFALVPMESQHLISADGNKSGLRMVQIFSAISILLLLIGAVNYVNLSTAQALDRAKDVSIRKIVGANRFHLFLQFLLETVVVFIAALIVAIIIIVCVRPAYNDIAQKSIVYSLQNINLWIHIGLAVFCTLCLASIYPAMQLSSFNPINALKGKPVAQFSTATLRKTLVIAQFTISIALIICTLIIKNQLNYVQRMDLGYDKDHVLTLRFPDDAYDHEQAIINELQSNPAIEMVSLSGIYDLTDYYHYTGDLEWPGKPENKNIIVSQATIDKHFLPLMDIQMLEGKNFTGTAVDSSGYIINETLAKEMGLTPPYVGSSMSLHNIPGQIIGVTKDFHFKSAKEKIGPMVFWTHWWAETFFIKTSTQNAPQAIKALEEIYKRYPSDSPFSYTFIDQQYDNLYKSEKRTGLLFNVFAGIAILISTLGLFALTTLDAQSRVKEIGIRKVLGASVMGIVRLLGGNFIVLILVSILIATPITLYIMRQWLNEFAYRTEINFWPFILGGIAAIAIALLTISFQAIRSARVNPVDSLRDE